jgi:ABC-type transporter Mla maintaining outer membrane lipid asymmetry ATPase subunit MlaF
MLRYSLEMERVRLPDHPPEWPVLLDLKLGLDEVLLMEGVSWEGVAAFWPVAATLAYPLKGKVLHWGKSRADLPQTELFRLRRQIAYLAPGQVLLQHLTLGENIALAISYYQNLATSQVLAGQEEFLESLGLRPYLRRMPAQLPPDLYWRGIWARELAKGPELVLACLDGPGWIPKNRAVLQEALMDYIARNEGAVLLAGPDLTPFYHLGHRLLRPSAGVFSERLLLQSWNNSPVDFFPLV